MVLFQLSLQNLSYQCLAYSRKSFNFTSIGDCKNISGKNISIIWYLETSNWVALYMQIWIEKGYIKPRYFWRRGNLVVVCVTAYVTFYCHLISLFYSDFVILGRFSCRGIDLLDLKQNKCWYNSMRDLNFCICIGLRLYRGHIRGDEIWKRSKERSTVFAKYMLDIASLFKIFFSGYCYFWFCRVFISCSLVYRQVALQKYVFYICPHLI